MERRTVDMRIEDDVLQKMQQDYILKEDIETVISHCERTGNKLIDTQTGHSLGHLRIGYMTFWVEYAAQGDGFVLFDCYAHRMQIQEDD